MKNIIRRSKDGNITKEEISRLEKSFIEVMWYLDDARKHNLNSVYTKDELDTLEITLSELCDEMLENYKVFSEEK